MEIKFNRKINIGSGMFTRLFYVNDCFYFFFSIKGSIYHVKSYDTEWNFAGLEKQLTPEGEFDVDQDIAFDGNYFYQFAMRRPPVGPGGQIRKFDKEFNLVKKTPVLKGENDVILDQNVTIIDGKIYAGSEYRENNNLWRINRPGLQNIPPNNEVSRGTHLRIFDKDLNLLGERGLVANIKGTIAQKQYWGLGASQLYADGYYCVVAASPIGNTSYFNKGESIGARQIFVLRFDNNFNFVDSKGPLTDTNNDNYWCTGSWYEDGKYYISYTSRRPSEGCVMGPPMPVGPPPRPEGVDRGLNRPDQGLQPPPGPRMPRGELGTFGEDSGNILLGIYDEEFKIIKNLNTTNILTGKNSVTQAAHRSKIFKMDDRLFITYDCAGAFVQEYSIK